MCKKREVYAVETGDYVGQMLIVVEPTSDFVGCLCVPNMTNLKVPSDAFERGRNFNILTLVDKLPRSFFKTSVAQYKHNENISN